MLTGTVKRLTFTGEITGVPLFAEMSKRFAVVPNILTANIIELKNGVIGNIVVHFTGEKEEVESALLYIREQGVGTEELGDHN